MYYYSQVSDPSSPDRMTQSHIEDHHHHNNLQPIMNLSPSPTKPIEEFSYNKPLSFSRSSTTAQPPSLSLIATKTKSINSFQQFLNYGCGCRPTLRPHYRDVLICDIQNPSDVARAGNHFTYCCTFSGGSKGDAIFSNTLLINGVQQGNGSAERLGTVITQDLLEINIFVPSNQEDTGFWAIVLDRQSNGSVASFSDIFDMSISPSGGGMAFKRMDTGNRFQAHGYHK